LTIVIFTKNFDRMKIDIVASLEFELPTFRPQNEQRFEDLVRSWFWHEFL